MQTLNLVYPHLSDIHFHDGRGNIGKTAQFPDGQQNIVIKEHSVWKSGGTQIESVLIKSRFNSFKDLELIICATKALRRVGVKEIHLYIPYLLGARSDRQFQEGGTSYLVDVIAPIINSLNFESVAVMDVHSDVAAACINNLKIIDNNSLVRFTIRHIYKPLTENSTNTGEEYCLISPDGGALKKIYKLAESVGYKGDIICCSKSRATDGTLSKVNVPLNAGEHLNKDFIIIDDICDGGATFINIAKELKEIRTQYSKQKIYLIVTHGIMSKGLSELSQYFDGIFCTNSVREISNSEFDGVNTKNFGSLVKQLNVF